MSDERRNLFEEELAKGPSIEKEIDEKELRSKFINKCPNCPTHFRSFAYDDEVIREELYCSDKCFYELEVLPSFDDKDWHSVANEDVICLRCKEEVVENLKKNGEEEINK